VSLAVLYRWRVDAAKEREFEEAWAEGTRLIHARCGSYGARLHKGADGLYWSYALWPDEETRRRCFEDGRMMKHAAFVTMQAAIVEQYDEIVMHARVDALGPLPGRRG